MSTDYRVLDLNCIDNDDLCKLPALASEYFKDELVQFAWTDTLRTMLSGVYEEGRKDGKEEMSNSQKVAIRLLRGHEQSLVRNIYSYLATEYGAHVKLTLPAAFVGKFYGDNMVRFMSPRSESRFTHVTGEIPAKSSFPNDYVSFTTCGDISDCLPTPDNDSFINVNMMPFIYGDPSSLPIYLQSYQKCIDSCPIPESDKGKIFYLTVHESYVDCNVAQRREGLHIEAPGTLLEDDENNKPAFCCGQEHHWGIGMFYGPDHYEGGIYMASNVADTSRVYDAIVDNSVPGIVDAHGGCEHLRGLFRPGTELGAGQLIWMTDRTPHEALPQKDSGLRQFFRVVSSQISHWYAKHSTPNPLVPLPDNVIVVQENKFD